MNEQANIQTRDCGTASNAGELTWTALLPLDHKPAEPWATSRRQQQLPHTAVDKKSDNNQCINDSLRATSQLLLKTNEYWWNSAISIIQLYMHSWLYTLFSTMSSSSSPPPSSYSYSSFS